MASSAGGVEDDAEREWRQDRAREAHDRLGRHRAAATLRRRALDDAVVQRGRLALQHHGGKDQEGNWRSPPSLVQFRNIYIKELD